MTCWCKINSLVADHGAKCIDLLQVSGQTAVRFLTDISELYPNATIRLLLLHKDIASKFDTDADNKSKDRFDHIRRVGATEDYIKTSSLKNIQIRYYRSYPCVCSVVVDNDIVCVGWYRTFFDGLNVIRVRSHNVPAVIALGHDAEPLLSFAKNHFDKIWKYSEEDSQSKQVTVREM